MVNNFRENVIFKTKVRMAYDTTWRNIYSIYKSSFFLVRYYKLRRETACRYNLTKNDLLSCKYDNLFFLNLIEFPAV